MSEHLMLGQPHRRWNALTGDWILVSPHRTKRPWQGAVERSAGVQRPVYDPKCYLCPGNLRAGNDANPNYDRTFAFTNDFSALLSDTPPGEISDEGLILARSERGICRVVCFSPRHDLTLAEMDAAMIRNVVDVWADEFLHLSEHPDIGYVQIFENRGEMMGASNPHPHGQIWAQRSIPGEPAKELSRQREHFGRTGKTLLGDYLALELKRKERVITENEHFVALVPFWAVWPYESMIISRRPVQDLAMLTSEERDAFADMIRRVTVRYDNLFQVSFPYSSGIHQRPTDGKEYPEWHLHMHFFPPLLRSATVRKFMVGYEMLAEPQRDITPESSAGVLRQLSEVHYSGKTAIKSTPPSSVHTS